MNLEVSRIRITQIPRSKNKEPGTLSKLASVVFIRLSKDLLVEILSRKIIEGTITEEMELSEKKESWMMQYILFLKKGYCLRMKGNLKKYRSMLQTRPCMRSDYTKKDTPHDGSSASQKKKQRPLSRRYTRASMERMQGRGRLPRSSYEQGNFSLP